MFLTNSHETADKFKPAAGTKQQQQGQYNFSSCR